MTTVLTSRKGLRAVSILAAVTTSLVLSACSSGQPDGAVPKSTGDAGTRVVKAANGDITVPAKPQRVVLIAADYLVELPGAPLVGTTPDTEYADALPAQIAATYRGLTSVGKAVPNAGLQVDAEAVAGLRPDLIVVGIPQPVLKTKPELLGQLSAIAPTVSMGPKTPNDRLADFPKLADALGMKVEAQQLVDSVNAHAAELKTKHAGFLKDKKALGVNSWADPGKIAIEYANEWDTMLPAMVGVQVPSAATHGKEVSLEQAVTHLKDADILITGNRSKRGLSEGMKAFMASPLWQQIPAAQKKMVLTVGHSGSRSWTLAREELGALDRQLTELAAR